jgi:N-acyl-D-amino-acid deacylase
MKALVERGMRDGALGLSSGLEYDPGFYATTDELVALAEVAARFGGFYSSHVRDEENEFLKAWSEAIEIGKRAHIPVEISHMKAASRPVWGQAPAGLALVDAAVRDGVSVVGDWYPYTYWHSSIYVLIPDRDFENRQKWQLGLDEIGGASHVLIASFKPDPSLVGKTLDQIAQARGVDPAQLVIDLVHEAGPDFGVIVTAMIEDDLRAILKHPRTIICSDGSITGRHPRGYGAFPRVLGRYVRDEHVLPLEEALAKMTSRSARQIGLHDRGELAVGKKADIVVFDPATIGDRGTPEDPSRAPVGVEDVVVNGELVLNGGQVTAARPGRALRRQDAPRPAAGSTSHGTNGS